MSIPSLLTGLILNVLPAYYVPVYMPPPVIYHTPTASEPSLKILDKLVRDTTAKNGWLSGRSMDTIKVRFPSTIALDTSRGDTLRPKAERLEAIRAWADSAATLFALSVRTRFSRSSVLDTSPTPLGSIRVGDSIPDSSRLIVVVEDIKLRPLLVGVRKGDEGLWIGNLEVTWGVWDPHRKVWALRGRRSLRTTSSEVRNIPPTEASEFLAKEVYETTAPRKVADPADIARRRLSYGGLHVLGDIGLGLNVDGDSRKLIENDIGDEARLSFGEFGGRILWVPNWYGFGAGASWAGVDVRVDESSASMWKLKSFYGIVSALAPVSKGESETSRNLLSASLGVGTVNYTAGDLWIYSGSGTGLFVRPEVGWTGVYSFFVMGINLGLQVNSVEVFDMDFNDKIFRMGMQLGFRAGNR